MRGRYFRYLFENPDGGLMHIGSLYDREGQRTTSYIYMVGSYCRNGSKNNRENENQKKEMTPERIDILVMGCYTTEYVIKLIHLVKQHEIGMIILPYLAPIQRLVLAEEIEDGSANGKETTRFLQDPYGFLKEFCAGKIYFLYGNDSLLTRAPEELEQGIFFNPVDERVRKLIREMEGYVVPVVQAGYIIENNWLFYFGVYGLDIQVLSDFTRGYFGNMENINELSENVNEDYVGQMKRLLQEYQTKFGSSPATTIVMFVDPLYAFTGENDCFMTEKESGGEECLKKLERMQGDPRCLCTVSCMRERDYDTMRQKRKEEQGESRFGILLLGNVNLNRYLPEVLARFWKVRFRIRGISVPNCGGGEDWNHKILGLAAKRERLYWICSKADITSVGVVSDIVLSGPNNRFLILDRNTGCCFSGYIVPKEDIE